jgi:hypothetical protein
MSTLLTLLKWLGWILIIVAIISSVFFTTIVTKITALITSVNGEFLTKLPTEAIIFVLLIVLGFVFSIWFSFFS